MCRSMEGTWNRLALRYLNDPRVLIAEMDCDRNNRNYDICDDIEVEYYPTYILFHNRKNVRTYYAMQSKDELISYVERYMKKSAIVRDEV